MKSPVLSICIATMNRDRFLRETLRCIVSQATDEVEIVIIDGGSSDQTESVVRGYQAQFPGIRYAREEKARGVDRDFNAAVELAAGEYCWLFSDDDMLRPEAVRNVLEAVRRKPSLVIVNSEVSDSGLERRLEERRLAIHEDRSYPPEAFDRLFADTAGYLSFIGGVIIRREIWLSRQREPYVGTEFIHVGVIFQAPLPEDTIVLAEPLVTIRYGVAQWSARSFDIWMFKWPGLIWSFGKIPDEIKQKVSPREPWRSARVLLTFRAAGAYSKSEYTNRVAPAESTAWKRFFPWLVARTPGVLVNALGVLYFFLFHRQALMPLVDLKNSRFYIPKILGMSWNR